MHCIVVQTVYPTSFSIKIFPVIVNRVEKFLAFQNIIKNDSKKCALGGKRASLLTESPEEIVWYTF